MSPKKTPAETDARRLQAQREGTYREQALKIYPPMGATGNCCG